MLILLLRSGISPRGLSVVNYSWIDYLNSSPKEEQLEQNVDALTLWQIKQEKNGFAEGDNSLCNSMYTCTKYIFNISVLYWKHLIGWGTSISSSSRLGIKWELSDLGPVAFSQKAKDFLSCQENYRDLSGQSPELTPTHTRIHIHTEKSLLYSLALV